MNKDHFPQPADTVEVHGVSFTHADIQAVVEDFYTRIQFDPVLEVPFRSVHDWPEHIERLTHFWWIRFGGDAYLFSHYNPVLKHFFAGFNADLLSRWLKMFHETLKSKLSAPQYELWSLISSKMGEALSMKNDIFRREYESKRSKPGTDSAD